MARRREELVPGQPDVIVFDSFTSRSLGPTIRIDVQSLTRLNELESIMRKLGSSESQQVLLSELGETHWVPPLADVVLIVVPSWATPRIRHEERGKELTCQWTNSIEGWSDSADEAAAMIANGSPCHQYFSDRHAVLGHGDSVTIELAYMK
jgi:hypothetical protein